MIGIYKIENTINNKCYIGQSVHIERRWGEHCQPSHKSVISDAIRKYGKENFTFQVLEECAIEELDEREQYYINLYNCVVPNGYNVKDYVDSSGSNFDLYDKEVFMDIVKDIQNNVLTLQAISEKYDLSVRTIYRINQGEVHNLSELNYPLRPVSKDKITGHYCIDCGKPIDYKSTRCRDCYNLHNRQVDRPEREELKNLIRNNSFASIGRQFNVADNTIRKWCKKYSLPFKKSDIKLYTDEEWELI